MLQKPSKVNSLVHGDAIVGTGENGGEPLTIARNATHPGALVASLREKKTKAVIIEPGENFELRSEFAALAAALLEVIDPVTGEPVPSGGRGDVPVQPVHQVGDVLGASPRGVVPAQVSLPGGAAADATDERGGERCTRPSRRWTALPGGARTPKGSR